MNKLVNILHLEDDKADAEFVLDRLKSSGITFRITRIQTRDEFDVALRQDKFDIILADYRLPSFDGISALQIKQKLGIDVPFIFVSGTMGEDAAIECLTRGATDYVLKQKLSRLVPAINRALSEAEVRLSHKRAEEALRASEELHRKLIASIPDLILRTDLEGNIVFINEIKIPSINTFSKEQFLGRNMFSFISPEDQERAKNNAKLMFEKSLGPREYRIAFDKGLSLACEVNGEVLRDIDNTPYGMVYVLRDITARKQAEDQLLKLSRAVEQSPVSIIITDTQGNIEYVNPKFTQVTGYTADEVIGKNPSIFMSGQMPPELYRQLWATITSGKEWFGEFHNNRKNGELFWESASISPIFDCGGNIVHFLAVKEDITERKQAEEELIRAKEKAVENDRLKSTFLANMSHEIRTPLNSIIGFSDLLIEAEFPFDQQRSFAHMINVSGRNLLTIISDIMDISKIEAGQIQVFIQHISINQLVENLKNEYFFKASEKKLELKLDPSDLVEELFIESDETKLRQILGNLIGNAIKFTCEGFIEIGIRPTEGFVQFHVKDTGIGIPKEFHQQIFERFRQVEQTYTRKYGGNGLGLAISKSLVELLGGTIWLDSEPGEGSTFYFTIPTANK